MLPAGLQTTDTTRIEFFARDNTAWAFYKGRVIHFTQVPEFILSVFRSEITNRRKYCFEIGITDDLLPDEQLEKYLMHCYGDCDNVPDFDNGSTNQELPQADIITRYELTDREVEVIRLQAQGYLVPAIAEKLFLSPSTVQNYCHSIKEKTGLCNSAEVVLFAVRHRFIEA